MQLRAIVLGVCVGVMMMAVHGVATSTGAEHRISALPGLNETLKFDQYAGYITVNATHHRNLFYWFVESAGTPTKDPLVIWLNGGPGCSSLTGLLSENGPFWPTLNGESLELNPWSWNRVANVIYLESPSGVGFSFSETEGDYTVGAPASCWVVGDQRTADDSYIFLLKFLELYPAYKDSPVWITGESYGGHYVPKFAQAILKGNAQGKNPHVNLAGIMVGNAWTDAKQDNKGAVFDWWSHSLIATDTYEGVLDHCDFGNIGPLKDTNDQCSDLVTRAHEEMGHISIYDIYANVCVSALRDVASISRWPGNDGLKLLQELAAAKYPFSPIAALLAERMALAESPCINNWVMQYLNRVDVQKAIHIKGTLPYKWNQCAGAELHYSREDLLTSMIPVHSYLAEQHAATKIRVLIFSGDIDGIVPTPGTRMWLDEFALKTTTRWQPWIVEDQVAGYVVGYESGYSFATVRGAGHMVPGVQPGRAFAMFKRFMDGNL